ncbi:hypothetical protein J8A20_06925 [Vibrio parahaemolyticus]|uniref:Zinc ribbon domain-containing protein n=3 Tax=Vibrio parahaemolyticus TaxID=670 RepID=A0AAW3ITG7_VIBPH|nr:hypothetical protein [Vibrio parahaemolyticus]AMG07163.2 hypothetical protein AL464_10365 [Vibrio parahaemolyticus]EGR0429378.1 hypothetical protein [Vibrio parahaemolyticus]EGR2186207.1 hypothetical protein [Vibrio parahaemolyticus]EJG0786214.1 hypothetical protein [Vibrio parahaemolyticus]EJG1593026.1 hypothetical protein [Vibrio parahaemolyticus]
MEIFEKLSQCIECKSELKAGAKKCAQCGAVQNWRRYVSPVVITAGFILTWLSIWTAPPIKELFVEYKAEMKISILEGDHTQLTFMLSNVGNSPAALSRINIYNVEQSGISTTAYLQSKLDNQLLNPNEAHVVTASNRSAIPSAIPHEIIAAYTERYGVIEKNCHLILEYVQLNGTKEHLYFPFACYPTRQVRDNSTLLNEN